MPANLENSEVATGLKAGGEGDDRGWDGWMASPTQWIWVWVNSRTWWWTGRPGVLQSMRSQRVGHNWAIELNWTELNVEVPNVSESHSVVSASLWFHGLYSTWNSLGQKTGVGSLSLLQGILLTQKSKWGLLHCRRSLYQLSYQESPPNVKRRSKLLDNWGLCCSFTELPYSWNWREPKLASWSFSECWQECLWYQW